MSATITPTSHIYSKFRGVDFSSRQDEVSFYRSPDALNMWKNYKNNSGKCVETRPDLELIKEYDDAIYGIYFYEINKILHKIVHSGTKLYDDDKVIYNNMDLTKPNILFISKLRIFVKSFPANSSILVIPISSKLMYNNKRTWGVNMDINIGIAIAHNNFFKRLPSVVTCSP